MNHKNQEECAKTKSLWLSVVGFCFQSIKDKNVGAEKNERVDGERVMLKQQACMMVGKSLSFVILLFGSELT